MALVGPPGQGPFPQVPGPQHLPPANSYIAYDRFILLQPHGNHAVFADDTVSLVAFKASNVMVIQADRSTMDGNTLLLPGELDPLARYEIATEKSRKVSRSLIKRVREIELQGFCVADLTEEHVRLTPTGKVKLRGIVVLENLNNADREARLRLNYQSASYLIEGLYDQIVPPEIAHLTNMMRNQFWARDMFTVHAGLVPTTSYPSLFKEIHDHAKFKIPKAEYRTILHALPHVDSWKKDAKTSKILSVTLKYNRGRKYKTPYNHNNQQRLRRAQREALRALGIKRGNQHRLYHHQVHLIRSLHFFDFLRNRIAHRMEACLKLTYTAMNSEFVTRVRFPLVLPVVQLQMHRIGSLMNLDLGPLFGKSGRY